MGRNIQVSAVPTTSSFVSGASLVKDSVEFTVMPIVMEGGNRVSPAAIIQRYMSLHVFIEYSLTVT